MNQRKTIKDFSLHFYKKNNGNQTLQKVQTRTASHMLIIYLRL